MLSSESPGITFRAFIVRVALFLLLLILLNQVAGAIYSEIVLEDTTLYRSERQFRDHQAEISLLIMGDSHSARGIDPRYLDGAFNFSSLGENYTQTGGKLRSLIHEGSTPIKAVILPLDLHSFSSFRSRRIQEPTYWRKYIDFWEIARLNGDWGQSLGYYLDAAIPYLGEYDQFIEWLRSTGNRQMTELGFMPRTEKFPQEPDRQNSADQRAATHLKSFDLLEQSQLEIFLKAIEACREHGISVTLVQFPLTPEYRAAAASLMDIEAFDAALREQLEPWPEVTVLNLREIFDGHPEYFADSDHLNNAGAQVFSTYLAQILRN